MNHAFKMMSRVKAEFLFVVERTKIFTHLSKDSKCKVSQLIASGQETLSEIVPYSNVVPLFALLTEQLSPYVGTQNTEQLVTEIKLSHFINYLY